MAISACRRPSRLACIERINAGQYAALPFIETATMSPHRGQSPESCTMSAPSSSPAMSLRIQVSGALGASSSSSTSLSSVFADRARESSCQIRA
jgi:hypothetical protein